MSAVLLDQIYAALARFTAASRLYELTVGEEGDTPHGLLVEAFASDDAVQGVGVRDVIVLSTSAHVDIETLLGQPASVAVSLADGTRTTFSGDISHVAVLGSNGGLARYRITIAPWLWRLSQSRNSRVWQDKSVIEIVDEVFDAYAPVARWRWSEETEPFMAEALPRSYCCQYRESDLDFVRRLLTEEGLAWRFEQTEEGPGAVIFADSTQTSAVPEDASSEADGGIRFHNVRAGERQDTIQALQSRRSIHTSLTTVLSYDYKAKKIVTASTPSGMASGNAVPQLESFDVPGQYAFANARQARRYADLHMQGHEARAQMWRGRSTLRTLRAGTRVSVLGAPLRALGEQGAFVVLRVRSVGVNNLPLPAQQALAELFGPIPELLEEFSHDDLPEDFALVVEQAQKTGYANSFDAIAANVPWREQLPGSDGRQHPRPTAPGSQSAIVVGADGNDQPNGADELYCDRLGRVRIRFHWQDTGDATCWVRVAQRSAGGGMGAQFLPRIGMEVLVQFLENDIDRPIIVGALYNGQGEGGVVPTPGGEPAERDLSCFKSAHDHAPSGQGNLAGGNSPVWHGASADTEGHRNAAAQWGIRSKEFGGSGYNQLLFDDTDAQGRIQLKSSHAGTELNLGHLIHTADNYRGSFRGLGAELRTDAYGAVRAGAGLLISSYKINHNASAREPAGDNAPGIAMLKQAVKLSETFSGAAVTHKTVALGAHLGGQKASQSAIDDKAAPLQALLTAVSGMVSGDNLGAAKTDAQGKKVAPGDAKLPHSTDGIIAIAAKAGLGIVAGQSVQLANGETIALMSGQDTQFSTGGQMRVHTGQAIGVLGGAMKPGEDGLGLQMIAGEGDIDIQAQADTLTVQARDDISVVSTNAHIDWAAAKSISLSTAGGANITIDGGNITVQCPGKLTIHAGTKHFAGPQKQDFRLPVLPVSVIEPRKAYKLKSTFAFDQLTWLAQTSTSGEFIAFLLDIFGYDIPPHTYRKLYDGMRAGSIPNPPLLVMSGGHYPAQFDNRTMEIRVHQAALDRAVSSNGDAWELLMALLHEFGHYIDAVLRHQFADKDADGKSLLADDSTHDEGAKYAFSIVNLDYQHTSSAEFAELSSPAYEGPLRVNYAEARAKIAAAQNKAVQLIEQKDGTVEFFPAGPEHKNNPRSFGHENIEVSLRLAHEIFNNEKVLQQIYFGNWLRDNSQLLDPKIVRGPKDPKDMTKYLSRPTLTKLVDYMAKKHFGHTPEARKLFAVTTKKLGVYRAVEHIDNPKNLGPVTRIPKEVDPDFEEVPSPAYTAMDPTTLMKKYIVASKEYMGQELAMAVQLGATPEGFRHFGAALHVLEDYFAHSNFVELSLRKMGFAVLPWTAPIDNKGTLGVVTGLFASEDVVASMGKTIADLIAKVDWEFKEYEPGKPTEYDEIALILLEEHSDQNLTEAQRKGAPTWLQRYQTWMLKRDDVMTLPGVSSFRKASHYTIGAVFNAQKFVFNTAIQQVGANVDDAQVFVKGDPNTNKHIDPSHSQLAKDHDSHHFHELAAQLAMQAVRSVGKAMAKRWKGDATADPVHLAKSYLVHPSFCTWQDAYVAAWAKKNPGSIERGKYTTDVEYGAVRAQEYGSEKVQEAVDTKDRTWRYVKKHYDDLMGTPPKGTKK